MHVRNSIPVTALLMSIIFDMNTLISIKIVLVVLFIGCLWDWQYGYYQFVRFIGMVGFGVLAYDSHSSNNNSWFVFYLASAVLINPLIKISLGRELWNIIDVVWATILLGSLLTRRTND